MTWFHCHRIGNVLRSLVMLVTALVPGLAVGQTCNNPTIVRLHPSGSAVAELRELLKSQNITVKVGQSTVSASWDKQSPYFAVNLQSTRPTLAELQNLTMEFAGFRLTPEKGGWNVGREGGQCISNHNFRVAKVWQVEVTAVGSGKVVLEVALRGSKGTTETPRTVPLELSKQLGRSEIDWDEKIVLTIYPVPGRTDQHYDVPLRASQLDREMCETTRGLLCHNEEEIRAKLRDAVTVNRQDCKVDGWRAFLASNLAVLCQNQQRAAIDSLPVVMRLEFKLQRP